MAASCLYIDGDILSYFSLAGYVLWFDAYQNTKKRVLYFYRSKEISDDNFPQKTNLLSQNQI